MEPSTPGKPCFSAIVRQPQVGEHRPLARKSAIWSNPINKRELLQAIMLQEVMGPPKSRQVVSKISLMQEISPSETK